ncbi:MAG: double-strand break repair protein AddB [Rhodospirillaceae bacterium]|jgi:ATP-dependent helicase/nuclease subunit B|nr:double-strand break repair protein AddB [Rhodospirillaceae bacterium]MBT5244966.1 double-strand break repair protein AddB [Rhodospirillaceae bacterium]MBT5562645.1 double-strand break repair protein AddB [Rhodospirillaceae bacterium]MBT6243047.1 double-strand break repair protein AddB [Rhodospirillaceae bacterium]MBT7136966.1 double-strand break repair protein AddB [Rhodospirillaceae bacterium]
MTGKPAVYTIAAGVPFLDALAAGILEKTGDAPEALTKVSVLLPTRRACRSLSEAFLRLSDGKPMLLPKMTPLGDIDEDELAFADDDGFGGETAFDIPPAISGLRRQLLLSRLILARKDSQTTPDQAARLAQELARLLDQVQTERLSFDGLEKLVTGDGLSGHWQQTLEFLTILTDNWPAILASEGVLDPTQRRNQLLDTQAALWRDKPPDGLVIAAGSTGSIPATADLLKVIAEMPGGMLVLPGLDTDADERVWEALEPTHPQYGLAKLLNTLAVDRGDVTDWPSPVKAVAPPSRAHLINDALIPASVTDSWQDRPEPDTTALDGVTTIEADSERTEAGMIALTMRQVLETKGKTAALVTPDRALARRVTAELGRWHIDVDDSAGRPLAETPAGVFLRLCARVITDDMAPVGLLALLKHPFAAAGMSPVAFRAQVRHLERTLLRGPRPGPGFDGLRTALTEVKPDKVRGLDQFIDCLEGVFGRFNDKATPLKYLLKAHVDLAEALAASNEKVGASRLWAHEDGEALAGFIAELSDAADTLDDVEPWQYPALFDALLGPRAHRPRYGRHPRLHIWGLLEARLQHADVMILGSLNEGSWPPEAQASPWMSRPMLEAFGLSQPERRLGLTAHDFTQAASGRHVIISRAARSGGSPSVPSRWLLRLQTLIKGTVLEETLRPQTEIRQLFAAIDLPEHTLEPAEPLPKPPLSSRPREMSVSQIETWIRDPYSIYARRILDLNVLDPIDADPGAAERGIVVHEALDRFIKLWPDDFPEKAYDELLRVGAEVFDEQMTNAAVRAFWWPRFERIADWFIDNERQKRLSGRTPLKTETSAEMTFSAPGGDFTLKARADRIDRLKDGGLAIIDYKTGGVPSKKQMLSGLTPQLTLEAAMAAAGNFGGVTAQDVAELVYMQLSGGREPGKESGVSEDVETLAGDALQGLQKRVADFDDESTPYLSRPIPMFSSRFGDYDHLARVKEWMAGDDGEDER